MRRTTRGSIYGDGLEGEFPALMERTRSTYDGFNRLKQMESIQAGTRIIVEYLYDGDGLRTRKASKSSDNGYALEVTNYLYDRQHVILETDGEGNLKARYTRGINYISHLDNTNTERFYLYNGHGDVVQTVDIQGNVQNNYEYDIFGNPVLTIEIYSNSIRYAGEFLDIETGLYYLRARYYNPYTGRFTSEDSYWGETDNPLSLNLYTYCANDPIMFIDPYGHKYIQHGSKGDDVKRVQEILTDLGYDVGASGADGIFGNKTREAVVQFQKDYGLQTDGIIGNQTLTYMQAMYSVKDSDEYAKEEALENVKWAKTGGITDDTILMSSEKFESAIEQIKGLRKITGGGSVQTSVERNQVVITGVTIPSVSGEKVQIKPEKPAVLATDTGEEIKFAEWLLGEIEAFRPSVEIKGSDPQSISERTKLLIGEKVPRDYTQLQEAQYYLSLMGFDIGTCKEISLELGLRSGAPLIDGELDQGTVAAIIIYQYSKGLGITGQLELVSSNRGQIFFFSMQSIVFILLFIFFTAAIEHVFKIFCLADNLYSIPTAI